MVIGVSALHSRLAAIPSRIRLEVAAQLEVEAQSLVRQMETLKPIPAIKIDWTWGEAPFGSVTIGTVRQNNAARLKITVYATGATSDGSFPAIARWFEFGTAQRRHKSGKSTGRIAASPYFFPAYRANRNGIRRGIAEAVSRGARNL